MDTGVDNFDYQGYTERAQNDFDADMYDPNMEARAEEQIQTQAQVNENLEFKEIKLDNDPNGDLYFLKNEREKNEREKNEREKDNREYNEKFVPMLQHAMATRKALADKIMGFEKGEKPHEYLDQEKLDFILKLAEIKVGRPITNMKGLIEHIYKKDNVWYYKSNHSKKHFQLTYIVKHGESKNGDLKDIGTVFAKNKNVEIEFDSFFKQYEKPRRQLFPAEQERAELLGEKETNIYAGKSNVVQATNDDIGRIAEETLNNIADDSLSEEDMNTALKKGRTTEEFKFNKFMREKYQYIREKFRKIKENIKKKIQYIRSSKDYDELEMQPLIEREEENLKQAENQEKAQIKEVIYKVRYFAKDQAVKFERVINSRVATIGDRLKALFKLKGVKLATIVTAVLMTISAIGASLVNGIGSLVKPSKPSIPDKPDIPSKKPDVPDKKPDVPDKNNPVKNGLIKFKNWLLALGDKALLALPSILGSIFSTILKAASSVVGILAEHLIIGIAVTILVIVQVLMTNAGKIEHKAKKISSKINEH